MGRAKLCVTPPLFCLALSWKVTPSLSGAARQFAPPFFSSHHSAKVERGWELSRVLRFEQRAGDYGSLFGPSGLSCALKRNIYLITPWLVQAKVLFAGTAWTIAGQGLLLAGCVESVPVRLEELKATAEATAGQY